MAGPRPRSLPLLAVLLAAALLLLPAVLAHGDHKGAHYGRKRTRNGRPARPFAKGRPTANVGGAVNATPKPSTTAAPPPANTPAPPPPPPAPSSTPAAAPPPPPPPPPPAPTSTSSTPPRRPRPTGPAPWARSTPGAAVAPLVSAADQALYLKFHNDIRANHKGDPLSWNDTLSAAAQKVADTCVFEHSGGKAIVSWTNESGTTTRRTPCRRTSPRSCGAGRRRSAVRSPCARPGTIFDPKFTVRVRAACAPGADLGAAQNTAEYYVCEYAPPGNIIGQFDQMVSV
ncbi:PR-1-like protein [Mycena indigotica]|uniref:PR-1-like protein n=1 Tax=Mycena indigotica TaxID=2126181 RepID=A0A8H6SSY8_9AGAR|nr:PR-1-like protein [Mycena indigotica]KAF7303385.1 PR-1-like protein [Mycena indigotica]